MIAPQETLALIPEELSAIEAAPMLCAGLTTFNALRHSIARAGDTVAVLGIGGLGHLAVQFCSKMGFNTIAIARGNDKKVLAKQLGAKYYVDSQSDDTVKELQKFGGAKVILSTVTNNDAISRVIDGLSHNGELIIVGVPFEHIQISAVTLITENRSIKGWSSGTSIDSEDTMHFSVLTGVRSMNETFPLDKVEEAYQLMISGKTRFRVVLLT